jgi:hypothetical protein
MRGGIFYSGTVSSLLARACLLCTEDGGRGQGCYTYACVGLSRGITSETLDSDAREPQNADKLLSEWRRRAEHSLEMNTGLRNANKSNNKVSTGLERATSVSSRCKVVYVSAGAELRILEK